MTTINWQPGMTLEAIEREAILQAFDYFKRNKTATANALGIAIRTLDNKLERYGADDKSEQEQRNERDQQRIDFLRRQRGLDTNGNFTIGRPTTRQVDRPASKAVGAQQVSRSENAQSRNGAEAGLRMESAVGASEEHAVSLPVGEKVQELPPARPAQSSAQSRRR